MISLVRRHRVVAFGTFVCGLALLCALPQARADKKKTDQIVKPIAGPRATALRVTTLYISPNTGSQKVDKVQIGREMVIAEKSGPWIRVFANTDIEEETSQKDEPMIGGDEVTPP